MFTFKKIKNISVHKKNIRYNYQDDTGKVRSKYFPLSQEGLDLAVKFKNEIEYKKTHGIPIAPPEETSKKVVTVHMAMQDWVDERKVKGNQMTWVKDWLRTYNSIIKPEIGHLDITKVTQKHINKIVISHWSDKKMSTKNRYLTYLKAMFTLAVYNDYLTKNPLAGWKKAKEERRVSRLTVKDLEDMQAAAPPHVAWLIDVAWHIPVRPGKGLYELRFDQFNFKNKTVTVNHIKVKKKATILLSDAFLTRVKEKQIIHKSGYVIEYQGKPIASAKKSLETAAKKANVPYNCAYDIRHLWITTQLNRGTDIGVITLVTGTSYKMIFSNYYEALHSQKHMVSELPELNPKKEDPNVISLQKRKDLITE